MMLLFSFPGAAQVMAGCEPGHRNYVRDLLQSGLEQIGHGGVGLTRPQQLPRRRRGQGRHLARHMRLIGIARGKGRRLSDGAPFAGWLASQSRRCNRRMRCNVFGAYPIASSKRRRTCRSLSPARMPSSRWRTAATTGEPLLGSGGVGVWGLGLGAGGGGGALCGGRGGRGAVWRRGRGRGRALARIIPNHPRWSRTAPGQARFIGPRRTPQQVRQLVIAPKQRRLHGLGGGLGWGWGLGFRVGLWRPRLARRPRPRALQPPRARLRAARAPPSPPIRKHPPPPPPAPARRARAACPAP